MKTQVFVDKAARKVVCTAFANGKCHDFRLFKESKTFIHPQTTAKTDTGYIGIAKIHTKSVSPRKRGKKKPLTSEDKAFNREVSSGRADNEHAAGFIKRFKIVSDRYRSRRKRFGLKSKKYSLQALCVVSDNPKTAKGRVVSQVLMTVSPTQSLFLVLFQCKITCQNVWETALWVVWIPNVCFSRYFNRLR
jgi:hypothetical protein